MKITFVFENDSPVEFYDIVVYNLDVSGHVEMRSDNGSLFLVPKLSYQWMTVEPDDFDVSNEVYVDPYESGEAVLSE